MTLEFETSDDGEIGATNMFRRGIEDAIAESRPISYSEYSAFMAAIGALVPGFVVKSVPKLIFNSVQDSIKATQHAIEFIKSHPSLPVSFDTKKALLVLNSHLYRQETFVALEAVNANVGSCAEFERMSLHECAVSLAQTGHVQALYVLLDRHMREVSDNLKKECHKSVVSAILAECPVTAETEPLITKLVVDVITPTLFSFTELADHLCCRARKIGESNPVLARSILAPVLSFVPTVDPTPLEAIRDAVVASERSEIEQMCKPVVDVLEILISAFVDFKIVISDDFNFTLLTVDRTACLSAAATSWFISSGDLEIFSRFCKKFDVDKDALIANQVLAVKELILSGSKRARLSGEAAGSPEGPTNQTEQLEVMFRLVNEVESIDRKCSCIYAALTAIHSLNFLTSDETDRFDQLAKDVVAAAGSGSENAAMLESYLSVISVQTLLGNSGFSHVLDRPDILMRRETVMEMVVQLAVEGHVSVVAELAATFAYIDMEEVVVLRLSAIFFALDFSPTSLQEIQQLLETYPQTSAAFIDIVLNEPFTERSEEVLKDTVLFGENFVEKTEFEKLRIIFRDFNLSLNRRDIPETAEWFTTQLGDACSDVEGMNKMERVRAVFNFSPVDSEDTGKIGKEYDVVLNGLKSGVRWADIDALQTRVFDHLVRCDEGIVDLIETVSRPLSMISAAGGGFPAPSLVCVADGNDVSSHFCSAVKTTIRSVFESPTIDETIAISVLSEFEPESMDFERMSLWYRLSQFSLPVDTELQTMDQVLTEPITSANTEKRMRSEWGALLESYSIPIDRAVILSQDKGNMKKILSEYFPLLVVRSKYDVELALKFAHDFRKPEEDVLIKLLELMLNDTCVSDHVMVEKSKCVLIRLLPLCVEKIAVFVIPNLKSSARIRWLHLHVAGSSVASPEWSRIDKLIRAVPEEVDVARVLAADGGKYLLSLVADALKHDDTERMSRLVEAVKVLGDVSKFTTETVEKVVAYPELVTAGQIRVASLLKLMECGLSSADLLKRVRALLQVVPLSEAQLDIAKFFQTQQLGGVSETDLKLLETRLVLKKHDIPASIETRSNYSIKKLIELVIMECAEGEAVVKELVELHNIPIDKLRIEIAKKWITGEGEKIPENAHLVHLLCGLLSRHSSPETVVTTVLKLYFAPTVTLSSKLACFETLFSLFSKSTILGVYNNPIEDLVEIQKQLTFLTLLSQTHKVVKPMEYRDFVPVDKALIAKNLVAAGGKDFVLLAAAIISDYAMIDDCELIERVEERLKLCSRDSVNAFRKRMHGIGARLGNIANVSKMPPLPLTKEVNENLIQN